MHNFNFVTMQFYNTSPFFPPSPQKILDPPLLLVAVSAWYHATPWSRHHTVGDFITPGANCSSLRGNSALSVALCNLLFDHTTFVQPNCLCSTILSLFDHTVFVRPYCLCSTILSSFDHTVFVRPYCLCSTTLSLFDHTVFDRPYCL